jgi:integrase
MPRTKKADKFPLNLHATGQWTKKVRGRARYFGTNKDEALTEYVRQRPYLERGEEPPPKVQDALTVRRLVNVFLHARRRKVDSGELSLQQWAAYHRTGTRLVNAFGPDRAVTDLRPGDFAKLRADVADTSGPVSVARFVTLARTVFHYAFAAELIPVPVRFGEEFGKPDKRVIRLARERKGPKFIPAADLARMIDAADSQVRAMVLLGLNCGFGQTDCARLNRADLIRRPGWIDSVRPKTGIPRRCPLWRETVAALANVEKVRPDPADPADRDLVFLTTFGRPWVRFSDPGPTKRGSLTDAVGSAFARLANECRVKVPGRFYTLRHVFRTVADEVKDRPAIDAIMGHADPSMGAVYRETIADDRLVAVTEHVRTWLLAISV